MHVLEEKKDATARTLQCCSANRESVCCAAA